MYSEMDVIKKILTIRKQPAGPNGCGAGAGTVSI